MPRDGAALLSEWLPKVSITCAACGLNRRYDRDQLHQKLGDVTMTELLGRLTVANGCSRQKFQSFTSRCPARYAEVPRG